MTDSNRRFNLLQTCLSALSLVIGGALHLYGANEFGDWVWIAGAGLVLIGVAFDTVLSLLHKEFGLDLIALLSIGGAIALHEYLTGAVIALMFASGRALEGFAERRARQEMSALLNRAPRFANRYEGNTIVQVPLESVKVGDRILVRAGETVAVDGRLLSDVAVIDASSLTGEPLPVSYSSGKLIESGTINAGDAFDMLTTCTAENSTFTSVIRLVQAAQASKAPASRLADRYALLFVPISLGLAGVAWLLTSDPSRALAVAVVATPCPLILAVPVAIVCAMSRCAQHGVLIKHGGAIEKMGQVNTLFFDKTGTLTGGKARLTELTMAPSANQDEVLRLAASVEQMSGHAIAQAVVNAALERGLKLPIPSAVQEEPGAGLSGYVDGAHVKVGTYEYVSNRAERPSWAVNVMQRIGFEGASGVYIAIDGKLCGALQMSDEIRMETPRAIRLLRAAGVQHIIMLTGDRQDVATTIGNSLGVDRVMAEQTPASKLSAITASRSGGITMMVGDGINDAPALSAADIGVAMGARGAAAAAESAQVVLLVDRLDRLAFGVRIAKRSRAIAVQSVVAGMGLSIVAMIVAAFGYLPPVAGAILQELIDVAVIFNALRVLRIAKNYASEKLPTDEVRKLKEEHARLLPIIDRLSWLADRVTDLPASAIEEELASLNASLHEEVLPHESKDDKDLYPAVARLVGGEDPMAPMSSAHREIYRLSRTMDRLAQDFPSGGPDNVTVQELRRTLYALNAILRLHFAQEEEIYHGLSS